MNIISDSVAQIAVVVFQLDLPPLTLISNSQSNTNRNQTLHPAQQARNTPPPLTVVSKGRAVKGTGVGVKAVPLTLVSKGKAVTGNGTERQTLREGGSLPVVRKGKGIHPNVNKHETQKPSLGQSSLVKASNAKAPLTVKKYDAVTVPAPFFGRFKSRIPWKAPLPTHQGSSISQELGSTAKKIEWSGNQATIDSDLAPNNVDYVGAGHSMVDDLSGVVNDWSGIVVETSEKAVQTDCFCHCYSGGTSNATVLQEICKISAELSDLRSNITGKTVVKKLAELFPIKSDAELLKIDYNIENTANFELRLKLYLKYLKPKSSNIISTAFKELIHDTFLVGKNWDGLNKAKALNQYRFFETILFDAWKNTLFTKDIYVSEMKQEIKKSHDRERKRGKSMAKLESSAVPSASQFI